MWGKTCAAGACAVLAWTPAMAADLPLKAPPAVAAYDWTGVYVGANLGYSVGRDPSLLTSGLIGTTELFALQPAGVIGGGQVGYNWQAGRWVLGVEADLQG